MVGVRLTEIWFKCWMVALVRLRHEWDFFLTFENNYRVYWAWTKYCIFPLIGQIFRPNHPTDQRQALIGCWWRPLDNDNIPNICSLPPLACPQSWWWWWRRRPGAWWLAGPGWPRVMGTSVSPLPSTLYPPSLLIIPTGCHTTHHNTTHASQYHLQISLLPISLHLYCLMNLVTKYNWIWYQYPILLMKVRLTELLKAMEKTMLFLWSLISVETWVFTLWVFSPPGLPWSLILGTSGRSGAVQHHNKWHTYTFTNR